MNNSVEGDRKAYYETSQWAIRQNKEEIGKLKNKNKELRDSIGKLKKVRYNLIVYETIFI